MPTTELRLFGAPADRCVEHIADLLRWRLRSELHSLYFESVKQGVAPVTGICRQLSCQQPLENTFDVMYLDEIVGRMAKQLAREIRITTLGTELFTICPKPEQPLDTRAEWSVEALRKDHKDLPSMKTSIHFNRFGFSLRASLFIAARNEAV